MRLLFSLSGRRPAPAWLRASVLAVGVAAVTTALGGCSGSSSSALNTSLNGFSQTVATGTGSQARAFTWAVSGPDGSVVQTGATVPFSLIQDPPSAPGTGPAGSIVNLPFPGAVQSGTFLNHFELHWNPQGHPPAIYAEQHFDIHAYNLSEAQVRAIKNPDPQPPAANRVPPGYAYPGPQATVPEMGVHAGPVSDFAPGFHFHETMILGYYEGALRFVEPMITREKLLARETFTIDIPVPPVLGLTTRYPTKFTARYGALRDEYEFIFSDFVTTLQ